MAVTSIWRVHGRVGKVLDYVENAEKTTAVSTGDSDLSDVIDYAIQQHKTSQTQVRDKERNDEMNEFYDKEAWASHKQQDREAAYISADMFRFLDAKSHGSRQRDDAR